MKRLLYPNLNKRHYFSILTLLFSLQTTPTVNAGVLYDEAISGDLNNLIAGAPFISPGTDLGELMVGINSISGNFGTVGGIRDDDIFTFTVLTGYELSSINLSQFQILSGSISNGSYFALNDGTNVGTGISSAANNLSDALINTTGNLLDNFIAGPYAVGSGIHGVLSAGTYSLFISETSASSIDYQIDLNVTSVPIPAAFWMFISTFVALFRPRPNRKLT